MTIQTPEESPSFPLEPTHPLAETAIMINTLVAEAIKDNPWLEANQLMALRTLGWIMVKDALGAQERKDVVDKARFMIRKDPMGRNAARIWEAFVIADGMKWDYPDERTNDREAKALEAFTSFTQNRPALRYEAQRKAYRSLLTDGEVLYAVFFGAQGTIPVTRFLKDSTEFLDPITHPDDDATVLYYVRKFYPSSWKFDTKGVPIFEVGDEEEIQFYRAWDADDLMIRSLGVRPPSSKIMKNAVGIRLTLNEDENRGWPMPEASVDWIKAFKGFMEDRVTISRALARFAWRLKGNVDQSHLSGVINELENYSADLDANIGTGVGRVFSSNRLNLDPIRTSTGGHEARSDARLIRQQVGAGVGITEPNLTGDPSVGNLASLTAMDGTMARNFVTDQSLLQSFWADLFSCVLTQGRGDANVITQAIEWVEQNVTVAYSPLVEEDIKKRIDSLEVSAAFIPSKWVGMEMLRAFGEKDPEQVFVTYGEPDPPEETGSRNPAPQGDEDEPTET